MSLDKANQNYAAGHSKVVTSFHAWRNVDNSVAYIKPYLQPHFKILDIGCGPGTITVDLARRVPQGHVTGLEINQAIVDEATAHAKETNTPNVDFQVGDIFSLPFPDASFDIVHVHQVLQHIPEPVAALREMRRVAKPGGFVAAREADLDGMQWWPVIPGMEEWRATRRAAYKGRGNPNGGRKVHVWARQAGLAPENTKITAGTWCFTGEQGRALIGSLLAGRIMTESNIKSIEEAGIATKEDLQRQDAAFKTWAQDEDAWFVILHGEIVCKV